MLDLPPHYNGCSGHQFPGMLIRFSGSSMLNNPYEKYDLSIRGVTAHMETLSFHEFLEFINMLIGVIKQLKNLCPESFVFFVVFVLHQLFFDNRILRSIQKTQ